MITDAKKVCNNILNKYEMYSSSLLRRLHAVRNLQIDLQLKLLSQVLPLFESLATSRVFGSQYPAARRKTIWYFFVIPFVIPYMLNCLSSFLHTAHFLHTPVQVGQTYKFIAIYIHIYIIYRHVFRCSTAHQCSLVQSGYVMATIYTQAIVSDNRLLIVSDNDIYILNVLF